MAFYQGTPVVVGARVYNSADISLTSGAQTALAMDSERWDTTGFHSTVSNTSRLTVPVAGKYLISGTVSYAFHALGGRMAAIRLNGTTHIVEAQCAPVGLASQYTQINVATIYDLAANDYVELIGYQDSGGSLAAKNYPNVAPEFMIVRLGI